MRQESGLTETLLWYSLSYLGLAVSVLSFLRAHHGEWLWSDRCSTDSRCSSWVSSGLTAHICGGWDCWWLWHPCLLIWQEILYFHCLSLLFFSWLHLTCGILVPQLGIEPSAVTTRSPNLWSLLFSLSVVSDSVTPGFPVPHHSCWSLLKLMSIESAMPSNHLYQGIPWI